MEGVVSGSCNHLCYYCINRNVWLSAAQAPGNNNEIADYMSTLQNENTDWRLPPIVFQRILEVFYCEPKIDPLPHAETVRLTSLPHGTLTEIQWRLMVRTEALFMSCFQPNRSSYSKIQAATVFVDHDYTMVENTVLVSVITDEFSDTTPPPLINFTIQKISTTLTAFKK